MFLQKFSSCSKTNIRNVLDDRAKNCFVEKSTSFCGNFKIESNEECDVGLNGDKCCNKDCTLKNFAKCSDKNFPCCENCIYANSSKQCSFESSILNCKENSYCSGLSEICPKSKLKKDGMDCHNK